MFEGMLLKEGFRDNRVPQEWEDRVYSRYPLLLDGNTPVEVLMVRVEPEQFYFTLFRLATQLKLTKFYAHFVKDNSLYVVYPHCIALIERGNEEQKRKCIHIGALYDIPANQLPIDRMFLFEHAEH